MAPRSRQSQRNTARKRSNELQSGYIYIYPRARLKEGSALHSSIESFKNKGKFTKMV